MNFRLNPSVNYIRYRFHLTPDKALEIFEQYDLILDLYRPPNIALPHIRCRRPSRQTPRLSLRSKNRRPA